MSGYREVQSGPMKPFWLRRNACHEAGGPSMATATRFLRPSGPEASPKSARTRRLSPGPDPTPGLHAGPCSS
jgi:hypothetical protein